MIDQEFEPIERGKLAFSLPIKIRKDSHIVNQIRNSCQPLHFDQAVLQSAHQYSQETAQPSPTATTYTRHGGPPRLVYESRWFRRPCYINFKDIVERWDTRLFETSYALIGEWSEDSVCGGGAGAPSAVMSTHTSQRPIGVLVLHIFELPPLPGVPPETLPQSLDGYHWGLSAAACHTKIYYQGSVTQNGGDIRR
ncbi:Bud site selection protein bud4 [Ceratobasidium sp. 423]|nr:Bud site selection protein bud4 [Ceratobasidium sp. 423]